MFENKIIFFIGIGGISMSALAIMLSSSGHVVEGSDKNKNNNVELLEKKGIKVYVGHHKQNIKNADIIVYSGAIPKDNEELVEAKKLNLIILSRSELLGLISKQYEKVIAISGSHGKTTTTAMVAEIFLNAKLLPTIHAGGILNKINSNVLIGQKKYFITEACEYKDSFLSLTPDISIILNISKEHMDFFKTEQHLFESFKKFAHNSNLVVSSCDLISSKKLEIGDYGYNAKNIKVVNKRTCFDLFFKEKRLCRIKLNALGLHNVTNALHAICVALTCNIKLSIIKKSLEHFNGVKRRMQVINKKPLIIEDYAHHPEEIKATLCAVNSITNKNVVVIFEPHTYSRTFELMTEFVNCFQNVSELIILKTYSARENFLAKGSAKTLYKNLAKKRKNIQYFSTYNQTEKFLRETMSNNKTYLFLGAGNINILAEKFSNYKS